MELFCLLHSPAKERKTKLPSRGRWVASRGREVKFVCFSFPSWNQSPIQKFFDWWLMKWRQWAQRANQTHHNSISLQRENELLMSLVAAYRGASAPWGSTPFKPTNPLHSSTPLMNCRSSWLVFISFSLLSHSSNQPTLLLLVLFSLRSIAACRRH